MTIAIPSAFTHAFPDLPACRAPSLPHVMRYGAAANRGRQGLRCAETTIGNCERCDARAVDGPECLWIRRCEVIAMGNASKVTPA